MVKPLSFKGDKKPKKRKRTDAGEGAGQAQDDNPERQVKAPKSDDADADEGEDDSWVSADVVSDISGPVMFVLPSDPPTALACDAAGKVFALPIENIVDANPSTAEPHDVRQVWVANRIVGTEHFRFKGHHGKYLTCDKIGLLTAAADAITPLESFTLLPTADTPGTFQIQTLRDTFLSIRAPRSAKPGAPPEVRGDEADVTFNTTLRVRMQARFKPRLKASREEKAREKISRRELEEAAGRRLEEDEVRMLKRARREGNYHEKMLDIKVKSKHDKFG
ncbi:FRG1-like family-domain-containing protein [Parachaetomium inaequale]|uniref:FRG1-like family-domain-containing protein n=1 Tax=Parachaetomium inaequale TaxID=2588326 RepID=A0AAN6PKD6_9PEZI|nr:FRG1-like family-domain-containing protein [Parachaetomium inaequale]